MTTNINKCVDEDARVIVNIDMDGYPNEYYDGSPAGNAWVNAKEFSDLAICPDKGCPSRGHSIKCYRNCFSECVTYILRNG